MTLAQRYEELKASQPRLRIRDAAAALQVSELDLVLLQPGTRRLRCDAKALMDGLPSIGHGMALTRNEWCVHERKGAWTECEISGPPHFPVGVVHNADIDLRLFLGRWKHMVHAQVPSRGNVLHAIQVFDQAGQAIHKVYATDKTDMAAFQALIDGLAEGAPTELELVPNPAPAADRPDAEIDAEALMADWAAMKDTHDFFGMLRKHKVGREQALRFAEGRFARKVSTAAVQTTLEKAAETELPIMCFVGNDGLIQIHSGPVSRILEMDAWINVMDPEFNLHLNRDGIANVWHVTKPTEDGDVNALEVYDTEGSMIVQFFGARKPGKPELQGWRDILSALA